MNQSFLTLNAGILSPLLTNRHDLAKRQAGSKDLVNCIVLDEGGVSRRPGCIECDVLPSDTNIRIVAFEPSLVNGFVFLFRNGAIDVYKDGLLIKTINTGWSDHDLNSLQFVQINDLLWVRREDIPICHIAWKGGSDFSLVYPTLNNGPWLTMTDQTGYVRFNTLGNIYVYGPGAGLGLTQAHIGRKMRIRAKIPAQSYSLNPSLINGGETRAFTIKGKWRLYTNGEWEGKYALLRTDIVNNPVTSDFVTYREFSSTMANPKNHDMTGTEDDVVYFKVRKTIDNNAEVILQIDPFEIDYIVEIVSVANSDYADVRILNYPFTQNGMWEVYTEFYTKNWSFEAFGADNGYPVAMAFHQGRMWLGGTKTKPQNVWGSVSDDYTNFKIGADDDNGLDLAILAQSRDRISWIAAGQGLMVGTQSSEWSISGEQGKSIRPSGFEIKRQSGEGSASIQPLISPQSLIYVKQGSTKIMELSYSFQDDGWTSQDLNVLAEHVLKQKVSQIAIQRLPYCIVWCVTQDGSLVGLTYNRSQQVVSWHRHIFGDGWKVLSCCVAHDPINGQTSGYDALWVAVEKKSSERMLMKVSFDPTRAVWKDGNDDYSMQIILMPCDVINDKGSTISEVKRIRGVDLKIEKGSELMGGIEGEGLTPVRFDDKEDGWVHFEPNCQTRRECCVELQHSKAEPFILTTIVTKWEKNQ